MNTSLSSGKALCKIVVISGTRQRISKSNWRNEYEFIECGTINSQSVLVPQTTGVLPKRTPPPPPPPPPPSPWQLCSSAALQLCSSAALQRGDLQVLPPDWPGTILLSGVLVRIARRAPCGR
eukprot:COSAG02_NODE_9251_length_2277_cov_2.493572_4_plen_122_part_00